MTKGSLVDQQWTVGQVAAQFGVTVRTLHHYDEVGLLVPSERSAAGYRLYTASDVERLSTIVVYRRLGLPLEEVGALLESGGADLATHLRRQRAAVMSRLDELTELVAAIDTALENDMTDQPAPHQDLKQLFGDGFKDEHQAEAKERWGDTDAWKQSQTRTSRYGKADWAQVRAEMDANHAAFVEGMTAGEPPTSQAAMDAAEQHRLHINDRFYALTHDVHRGLADMYLADPRFTRTYEDIAAGLAAYVHDAIHANADRHA